MVFLQVTGFAIALLAIGAILTGSLFDNDLLEFAGRVGLFPAFALAIGGAMDSRWACGRMLQYWSRVDVRNRERGIRRLAVATPVAVATTLAAAAEELISWREATLMIAFALVLLAELLLALLLGRRYLRKHRPEGFWWKRRYDMNPVDIGRALMSSARSDGISVLDNDHSTDPASVMFLVLKDGEKVARIRKLRQTFRLRTLAEVRPGPTEDLLKSALDDAAGRIAA